MTDWEHYERFIWALTVWREASNQPYDAKVGVACSIKNRVEHPAWWGKTMVEVCTKREQYTSMNTKRDDPNLRRWPQVGDAAFLECLDIVRGIQSGMVLPVLPGTDSYYDDSIPMPWWAKAHPERHVGDVGAFHFYDMDQDIERDPAAQTALKRK